MSGTEGPPLETSFGFDLLAAPEILDVTVIVIHLISWAQQWQGSPSEVGSALAHEIDIFTRGSAILYPIVTRDLALQGRDHAAWHASPVHWGMGNEGMLFVRRHSASQGQIALASSGGGHMLVKICCYVLNTVSLQSMVKMQTQRTPSEIALLLKRLTPRERDILHHMLAGAANAEIAKTLGISIRTVESHQQHLYQTLGVHSRAEAVVIGMAGSMSFL